MLSVVDLPCLLGPGHQLQESLVVLIDVLRMTSTVVTAMGSGLLLGAKLLGSLADVKQHCMGEQNSNVNNAANAAANNYSNSNAGINLSSNNGLTTSEFLLCGEQKRVLMPGFDRDNSPISYLCSQSGNNSYNKSGNYSNSSSTSSKRTGLFLTTNGTRALPWVKTGKLLVLGSLLNLSAVTDAILRYGQQVKNVVLVCSGTERGTKIAEDDILCAGAIVREVVSRVSDPSRLILDEGAVKALRAAGNRGWGEFINRFRETPGARELYKIGLEKDVSFCLEIDRFGGCLPVLCGDRFLLWGGGGSQIGEGGRIRNLLVPKIPFNFKLDKTNSLTLKSESQTQCHIESKAATQQSIRLLLISGPNDADQLTGRLDPQLHPHSLEPVDALAKKTIFYQRYH